MVTPSVQLRLGIGEDGSTEATKNVAFEVSADKFRVLHSELALARQMMEAVSL